MKRNHIEKPGQHRAAGCMVMAQSTGRFLMSLRASGTPVPSTWATWGGKCLHSEHPEDAAIRELREETDIEVSAPLQHLHHFERQGFQFDTYLAVIRDEVVPKLTGETAAAEWFDLDAFPTPLHEGVRDLLASRQAVRLLRNAVEGRIWMSI